MCSPISKNNVGKRFLNFFNFFAIFFGIFLPRSSMNGIRKQNFFFSFSAYLVPFWLKIMSDRGFFDFFNFFAIFFGIFLPESSLDGIWKQKKFFFSLSWPISSRFG